MTILDLVRILRSNLKLLLLTTLVGILLAAAYTLTRPVEYTTSSTAQVVAGSSQDSNSALVSQQLATGRAGYYAQLAGGEGVATRILKASNGALKGGDFRISGSVGAGGTALVLGSTGPSPAKAQTAANLAPKALAEEALYLETLGTEAKTSIYHVVPLTSAGRPSIPSSPNWKFNLVAGALLGLLAGIVVVVLRKQLDSRVRHTAELEKITGAGVLGVIPKAKDLQNQHRGGLGSLGPTAESFRMLRTNLRYVSAETQPRSLVVTSAVQGEGKSTVAANLARVLAAAGQQVILVDTDLRRPVVHETFDLENTAGLTEVLTGQASLRDVINPGGHSNLKIITAGRIPPNPSELLGSRRMSAVIDSLQEEYFVVLDAPPLLPVTDAGLLAVAADGVATVYQYGSTHREQVALSTKIIDQVNAHNFGAILNMTPPKEMGTAIYGYGAGNYGATGYGYGYGYGASDDSDFLSATTASPRTSDLELPRDESQSTTSTPLTASTVSTVAPGTDSAAPSVPSGATVAAGESHANEANAPRSRRSLRRPTGD